MIHLFAEAASLIPEVTPPPDTNWYALVAAGATITAGITAAIRREVPSIDGRLVYALVLPVSAGVALWQVGYADLALLAKHAGYVFVWSVGGTAGLIAFLGWAAKAFAALLGRSTIPPEPPAKKSVPPPLPVITILCLTLCLLACSNALPAAIITADAMADTENAAAPILKEKCVEPMQAAALAGDKARGQSIAAKCDGPVAAYDAVRVAHVALSEAIVSCASGKCSTLAGAVSVAVNAISKLAPLVKGLVLP